jgi:peptidoglycan/LPS O-acetylase OafA/YrhL
MKVSSRSLRIDALRGLAALTVMVYHARAELWTGISNLWHQRNFGGGLNTWLGYLTLPFSFGDAAVMLFFVISGYCIHYSGAKRLATAGMQAKPDWKNYFWKRFWRIYPTYVAALIIAGAVDYFAAGKGGSLGVADHSISAFLGSLVTVQNILTPQYGTNGVFWSLAIEVHLYLFYPVMFWVSRKYGCLQSMALAFILSLLPCLTDLVLKLARLGYQLPGPLFLQFLFIWMLGFYVAEIQVGRVKMPSTPWHIWLVMFTIGIAARYEHWLGLSNCFFGIAFFGLVLFSAREKKEEECGWLVKTLAQVGIFSYSLYAIHRSVLLMLHALIDPEGLHRESLFPLAMGIIMSVMAGILFYFIIERWSSKIRAQSGFRSLQLEDQ